MKLLTTAWFIAFMFLMCWIGHVFNFGTTPEPRWWEIPYVVTWIAAGWFYILSLFQ